MEQFNLQGLRDLLTSSWPTEHQSMNPDDDIPAVSSKQASGAEELSLEDPEPIPDPNKILTHHDLLDECDNFPYYMTEPQRYEALMDMYYVLLVADYPELVLGYVLPSVAIIFKGLPDWEVDEKDRRLTLTAGTNTEERSKAVAFTTQAMRKTGHFKILDGWRDELYAVYGQNRGEILFNVERAATPLFGVVAYGVHMTCYTMSKSESGEKEMKIWVPRRSPTKQTWPGRLDNSVGGGISTGEVPSEAIIREAEEEASLPAEYVRANIKPAGAVTYISIRDSRAEAGRTPRYVQPECQYVYDLQLTEDMVCKPHDDEVENFELMTLEEVKEALRKGEFKPNCAFVLLDFFVRNGVVTTEDDDFLEITTRLHRRLEFALR